MLDKARAHRLKNRPQSKREEIPLWDIKKTGESLRSTVKRWPEFRQQIKPWLSKSREKIDAAYSSLAKVFSSQKEALEDRLAEKRHRAQPDFTKPRRTKPKPATEPAVPEPEKPKEEITQ
jgi:lipopolysaccharide biosynthesis regulator YciM